MYLEQDKGTPETQKKLGSQLKRGGLDYLFQQKTLNPEQRNAGNFYAWCFRAWHQEHYPQSSLSRLAASGGGDPYSDAWQKLAIIHHATGWKKLIDARLKDKTFITRKPYLHIIQHVAGLDSWNLQDVKAYCAANHVYGKISDDTASRWTRQAFDVLVTIISDIKDSWERDQKVNSQNI